MTDDEEVTDDEERQLRLVERELEEAPEPPPRSPEQRERMRREFMAALDARVKKDAAGAGARPPRKNPARIAAYSTAVAGVSAAAGLVLWLWFRPSGEKDNDGRRAGSPVMAISAEADAGAPPSPTMTPRRPRRPSP